MSHSLPNRVQDGPRKSVRCSLPEGETAPKSLRNEDDLARKVVGAIIESALNGAGFTKQSASWEMGYGSNQASVSNWISGKENPQMSRLWRLGKKFRRAFLVAWADACEDGDIEVHTTVTVRDRKASA